MAQRELGWLLDDAVAGCHDGHGASGRQAWTWRDIKQRHNRIAGANLVTGSSDAVLRLSLDELSELWRMRLHDR